MSAFKITFRLSYTNNNLWHVLVIGGQSPPQMFKKLEDAMAFIKQKTEFM